MDNYLSEERFSKWEEEEFNPMRDKVAGLPCDVAAVRVTYVYDKVDDLDLKIDSIIGTQSEDSKQSINDISNVSGKLAVLLPLVIANLSTLIGVLLYLLRNGAG